MRKVGDHAGNGMIKKQGLSLLFVVLLGVLSLKASMNITSICGNTSLTNKASIAPKHYLVYSMPEESNPNGTDSEHGSFLECKERLDALEKFYDERRGRRQQFVSVARANSQTIYESKLKNHFPAERLYFDMWEPEAVCLTEERSGGESRFDAFGDGPKFICGVDYLRELYARSNSTVATTTSSLRGRNKIQSPCLVYSIGSNNDISFEKVVKRDIGCEIHTFDPTLKSKFIGDAYASFHPWGLGTDGAQTSVGQASFVAKSLDRILGELGHVGRRLNILKIDCEGCEYDVMPPVFEAVATGGLKIDQILIELHRRGRETSLDWEAVTNFFERADKAGYRITHKERNGWGCNGWHCVEYALVSNDYLRRATASIIC
eukprot:scaffold16034_cov38-Cyclotella_meneghiniana.AAC.2